MMEDKCSSCVQAIITQFSMRITFYLTFLRERQRQVLVMLRSRALSVCHAGLASKATKLGSRFFSTGGERKDSFFQSQVDSKIQL